MMNCELQIMSGKEEVASGLKVLYTHNS